MAQYFSISNGNLGDINAFGASLSTAEVMNATTNLPLLTSSLYSSPATVNTSLLIPQVAINLSSVNTNPSGNLNLTIQQKFSPLSFVDSSISKSNITSTSNTYVAYQNTFTPFGNGWSAYFFPFFYISASATIHPYITLPNPTTNLILTNDFTIETWVHFLSAGNGNQSIIQSNWGAGGNSIALWYNYSTVPNKISFWVGSNSTTVPLLTSNTLISPNTWYHIAVTRSLSTFTLYINGSAEDTKTNLSIDIGKQLEYIGAYETPSFYLSGYMSNLRIVKGQSLFNGNFTPPTSELILSSVGSTGNVAPSLTGIIALQTFQNNRFIDNSPNNLTVTNNNVVKAVKYSPFNVTPYSKILERGSIYIDGTSSDSPSITISHNNNLNFTNLTALTIEAWIYFGAASNNGNIFRKGNFESFVNPTNGFSISDNSSIKYLNTVYKYGEWTHVALVLSGISWTGYFNGVKNNTIQHGGISGSGTGDIIIGGARLGGNVNFVDTYISNYRITKSILYTENFPLTTTKFLQPLSAESETCLLLNFDNFGTSNTTELYPVSSFTKFNGNNNTYSRYSQNWQTLKLSNPLSTIANDNIILNLKTENNNQIELIGSSDILIDVTGTIPISSKGSVILSSVNIPNNINETSVFLNGTDNWLVSPANKLFAFPKDFTIEFWINTLNFAADSGFKRVLNFGVDSATNLQLIFANPTFSAAANTLIVYTNTTIISGNTVVADGNWHHVSLCRAGNIMKLFVDGKQSGNTYISPLNSSSPTTVYYNSGITNLLSIGSYNNTNQGRLSGYLANLRIIKDRALYTTNFVASSQVLSATLDTILLLKNSKDCNKTIIYNLSGLTSNLVNNGSVTLSSASPFGNITNGSLYFSGTNSLSGTTDTNFGTGDFTIEGWFNLRSLKETGIFQTSDSNTGLKTTYASGVYLRLDTTTFYLRANIANTDLTTTFVPTINTWYHFAITRQSGFARLFINGKLLQSGTISTSFAGTFFTIGNYYNVSIYHLPGSLSNIRFIKGQSLYNNNFNVPTSPLSLIYGTVLLINTPHSLTNFQHITSAPTFTDVNIGGALIGNTSEFHTITAESYTLSSLEIHNKGILTFPHNSSKTLNLNGPAGIQITSEGTMNIGTSSVPISSTVVHIISSNNTNISMHVHNGGNLNVYGAYKVPYSHLSINSSPTGRFIANQNLSSTWLSGDNLVLTCNISGLSTYDNLVLSGFENDRIFRTTTNSIYSHTGINSNPYIPSVSNLTRNVLFNTSIYGADNSKININNVLFNNIASIQITTNLSSSLILNNNVYNNYIINSFSPLLWSGLFNGSNNYITIASNPLFAFPNDFTIEMWVNVQSFTNNRCYETTIANGAELLFNSSGKPSFGKYGVGVVIESVSAINLNTWYHIAVSRSGTNTRIFVNGEQTGINTNDTHSYVQGTLRIGADGLPTYYHNGYISNLRVVKGKAIYTGNFVPSTIPLTTTSNGNATGNIVNPLSNEVALLTLQNNVIVDNSLNNLTITNTNNVVTTNYTNFIPYPINNLNNFTFSNNVLYRNTLPLNYNNLKGSNINITDNMFLCNSSARTGLELINISANNLTMSGNYVVGLSGVGTYIQNCSATGIIGGTMNFNGTTGVILSGSNSGNINASSVYSKGNGIFIDSSDRLLNTTFSNITSDNNILDGILLSGNNLNYLTPTKLNINNLQCNNNLDVGLEGYNIIGNLNNVTINDNLTYGIKTSIGNGPTIFEGLTSKMDGVKYTPYTNIDSTLLRETNITPFQNNNWSAYFTNTPYLSAGTNTSTISSIGTSDFTVEAWIYLLSLGNIRWFCTGSGVGNGILALIVNTNGTMDVVENTSALATLPLSAALTANTWNHIAVTRNSTKYSIYKNGNLVGTGTSAPYNFSGNVAIRLGGTTQGGQTLNGYMSNFRLVKNQVLYNNNFIPSNIPLTTTTNGNASGNNIIQPLSSNVILLTLQNNRFIDNSPNNYNVNHVIGTVGITSFVNPLSGIPYNEITYDGSGYFNGATRISYPAGPTFAYGNNNFTIEFTAYRALSGTTSAVFSQTVGGQNYLMVGFTNIGQPFITYGGGGGFSITGSTAAMLSTWNHVAIVRSGLGANDTKIYLNGNEVASGQMNYNFNNTTYNPTIGGYTHSNQLNFTGYISNLRVSNSAVYLSNFTSPNLPLNINKNVALLFKFYPLAGTIKTPSTVNINIGILSAYNYSETIISNAYLSSIGESLVLDSSKLENLTLNNTKLQQMVLLSSNNIIDANYNINNSDLGSSAISQLTSTNYGMLNVMNGERITNNHYRVTPQGKISYDSIVYKTSAPSEKLEPTGILKSSSKLIAVNKGDSTIVSVYIKKSLNYTGTAPKLILKRNASMGYDTTILRTSISSNDVWELLTGNVPAALNDGIFEVYVECSGFSGSGSINIDEWDFS